MAEMFGRKKSKDAPSAPSSQAVGKKADPTAKKSSKESANLKQQSSNHMERLPAEPPEAGRTKTTKTAKTIEAPPVVKQGPPKLTINDVMLRPIREKDELKLVLKLWKDEEWRLCASDIEDLLEAQPNCIWGAFHPKNGQLLGCCLVTHMDGNTAFLSHLITSPQHRKQGVATLVFNRASKVAGERNLLLATAIEMEEVFERWLYHFSRHQICSCDGQPKLPETYAPPTHFLIQPITFINLADVLEFDQSVCGIDRSHEYRALMKSENTIGGLSVRVEDEINGFAILRRGDSDTSVRLSAFYAESYDAARALLYSLIKQFVKPGTELVAWFSIVNIDRCRKLFREFGMDDPESQFRVMYSKEDINIPWSKVYGIYEYYANLV